MLISVISVQLELRITTKLTEVLVGLESVTINKHLEEQKTESPYKTQSNSFTPLSVQLSIGGKKIQHLFEKPSFLPEPQRTLLQCSACKPFCFRNVFYLL